LRHVDVLDAGDHHGDGQLDHGSSQGRADFFDSSGGRRDAQMRPMSLAMAAVFLAMIPAATMDWMAWKGGTARV